MDNGEYAGLVRELEALAEHDPAGFRRKVFFIGSAAYIALAARLLLTLLVIYFGMATASGRGQTRQLVFTGVFTLTMIPVYYVVLRMVFMRLDAPDGREIGREEAPKLFAVLDKMRQKLQGPMIHRVVIDREFNAAIAQVPRFGLFGGHRNHLILGLPYLFGVTPKEMLATVAHEYGHLCGDHGKLSAWIYRQRRTFGALHHNVEQGREDSLVYAVLAGALSYFWPYYNAYTFVVSRQNEYEADLTATELVGALPNASGLIRGELLADWLQEQFWRRIHKQVETLPAPTLLPYATVSRAFALSYAEWATAARLRAAWLVKSDVQDTHPCLQERVTAIGEKPALPPPVAATAAEALLGTLAKTLVVEFDEAWWQEAKKPWLSQHQRVTRAKARHRVLHALPMASLPLHELQEFALLTAEFESPQAAKPVLEYLLAKPGGPFPKPSYHLGRILLSEQNDRGLGHLFDAAKADRNIVDDVVHIGYRYLLHHKDEAAADAWVTRFEEFA